EKTGGRLEMQVFPASQLGTQRDMIEALGSNALQLYTDGAGTFGSWVPAISVLEAPYIWRDAVHMTAGMASPEAQRLFAELVKTRNMRIIDTIYYGTRHLTTASKPVKDPKDLIGFKLRVPPVDVFNAMAEAWGARPTPINFGELYLALKQEVVDGQENPLPTIQSAKIYEVQKYLVLTAHIITPRFVVVNEQFWQGLPAADRAIMQAAIAKAVMTANAEIIKQENELADTFAKGGMTVIKPDVAAFREPVVKLVPPKFESRWGKGTYERLQSL
ncbi:MAG TPA: sialic acid TRAP transporter substrate-binding protein SiaP, partial [Casimicrobiaceae bacterium]|nr:sialic acid TRAP transporter substrate-binding protein SiaP [Casimicrobiaceae bacterium]